MESAFDIDECVVAPERRLQRVVVLGVALLRAEQAPPLLHRQERLDGARLGGRLEAI